MLIDFLLTLAIYADELFCHCDATLKKCEDNLENK